VGFFAGLGRQSEGNWAAVGLAQNHLLLVDGVGGIPEPGNVEASLLLENNQFLIKLVSNITSKYAFINFTFDSVLRSKC